MEKRETYTYMNTSTISIQRLIPITYTLNILFETFLEYTVYVYLVCFAKSFKIGLVVND